MLPKNIIIDFESLSLSNKTKSNNVNEGVSTENKNIEIPVNTQIKKNRCTSCNKKVGLLGFECKCGGNFCTSHRHADQHDCKSINDIIQKDREILAKQNIKVVADKLEKI